MSSSGTVVIGVSVLSGISGIVVGADVTVGGALVLDVVRGVGKKGLKVVVGVREV